MTERPVHNWFKLVRTKTGLKTGLDWYGPVFCSPVWFFEVLGHWWTGLGLGLFKNRQKTGLDRTFKLESVSTQRITKELVYELVHLKRA